MIVKLQLSLSDPDAQIFAYNEDRSLIRMIPQRDIPSPIMKVLGKRYIIYCDAEATPDGILLGTEQPAQAW
jgi:hypothetical protein